MNLLTKSKFIAFFTAPIILPITLGVATIPIEQFLYRKLVTEMTTNFDNFKSVLSKVAGFTQIADPEVALTNIVDKLKIAEGIACAVGVLSIIGGASMIVVFFAKKNCKDILYPVGVALMSLGGLSIGAKFLFNHMKEFLPSIYADFSAISHDVVSTQALVDRVFADSNPIMIGSIVAASILGAIAITGAILLSIKEPSRDYQIITIKKDGPIEHQQI